MKDDFFCRKQPITKKMTLAGFSQRGSQITWIIWTSIYKSIILTGVEVSLLLLAYSYKHLSVWSNPWGQLYPHRKQLHFHFLLWLSRTGSFLFVKAKANKRPLLCLYFKLLWQHLFNTCTHTYTHTHLPYLFHLDQLPACVFIIPQVLFIAHKDDGNVGAEMFYLWRPFLWNILWKMPEKNKRNLTSRFDIFRKWFNTVN